MTCKVWNSHDQEKKLEKFQEARSNISTQEKMTSMGEMGGGGGGGEGRASPPRAQLPIQFNGINRKP